LYFVRPTVTKKVVGVFVRFRAPLQLERYLLKKISKCPALEVDWCVYRGLTAVMFSVCSAFVIKRR
jgi:hypothetical protein